MSLEDNNGTQYYSLSCRVPSDSGLVLDANNGSQYYYKEPNDYILWGQDSFYPGLEYNNDEFPYYYQCNRESDPSLNLILNNGSAFYYNSAFNCIGWCNNTPVDPIMPEGAVGLWYADEYSTFPRPHIPNEMSTIPVSSMSLLSVPRRQFSHSTWTKSGIVATDVGLLGPDGTNQASLLSCGPTSWNLAPELSPTLAAGTYTLGVWIRSHTEVDQQFQMWFITGNTLSPVRTATSEWTRFTLTATVPAGVVAIRPLISVLSGAAMLEICDLELFAGNSDLHQPLGGHMSIGITGRATTLPTFSASMVDFSINGYGEVQLPTSFNTTNFTAIAVTEKVVEGGTYQSYLADLRPAQWPKFASMFENPTQRPAGLINSVVGVPPSPPLGDNLWKFLNKGTHMVASRYNGFKYDIFLDDVQMFTQPVSTTGPTISDFDVMRLGGFKSGRKLVALALYARTLTNTEIREAYASIKLRASENNILMLGDTTNRIIAFEGESLTAGNGVIPTYANLYAADQTDQFFASMVAQSGSYLNASIGTPNLPSRVVGLDAIIPSNRNGRIFTLSVQISNDLLPSANRTPEQFMADLIDYLSARRAAGWDRIILATILPRRNSNYASFNTKRDIINPIIRTWVGLHCDAIADFAGNPTMGPQAAADDVSLYYDGVHPTLAGQTIMTEIFRDAYNSL